MERRRQGVRYVVGKSPPPPDVPSPYMEAQFNPTIAACTEYIEDDDLNDLSDEKLSCESDADIAISPGPLTLNHSDETAMSRTQEMDSNREPLQTDMQPTSGALNGLTSAETREETGSHTLPLPIPDADAPALPTSREDLPGLCSTLTYGLRLIIGKPLSKPMRKKSQLNAPQIKKRKVIKSKRQVDVDVSDYEHTMTTRQKVGLPLTRVGGYGLPESDPQKQSVRHDEKDEDKESIRGSSPMSDTFHLPLHADEISTPPPAEPVLVPTEYYAPSKLDATIAKSSQAQFGHTYWSFNAVNPRDHGHEHEHHSEQGHASSSSLLMSTPLYFNNDRHSYPQFSIGDMSPVGPSATESASASASRNGPHQSPSESISLSNSHTPDDYLYPQAHTHSRDVDGHTAHGLSAFTTLDDTWAPVNMDPYPNLEIDMSPMQVEGIHAVDATLHKHPYTS